VKHPWCWLLLCSLAGPVPHAAGDPVDAARAWHSRHGARLLAEFAELLAIPNVAAQPAGLRSNAELIRSRLAARGAQTRLVERPGVPPAVLGTLNVPGAKRTLGLYLHYDGQPVEPADWTFPPFEPTLTTGALFDGGRSRPLPAADEKIDPEWRIYARSSGDDRAPVAALTGALDALETAGIARTANLVFFFEGEEEIGSPHLGELMEDAAETLATVDLWLICDGPLHTTRRPQLVFGVRGYTELEITVYGANRYLHSGALPVAGVDEGRVRPCSGRGLP
jgi:acetylornithine deacetylase/succinyl-diaminopimelate desuccinylase-like protein